MSTENVIAIIAVCVSKVSAVAAVGSWISSYRAKAETVLLKTQVANLQVMLVNSVFGGAAGGGGGTHGGAGGGGGGGFGARGGDGGGINF